MRTKVHLIFSGLLLILMAAALVISVESQSPNFSEARQVQVLGLFPAAVTVADLNSDRRPDLAVAYQRCDASKPEGDPNDPLNCAPHTVKFGRVAILLNPTFNPDKEKKYMVGESPSSVVAGDFNGDGILDLAVANFGDTRGNISILLGTGNGGFTSGQTRSLVGNPSAIAVGDFNNDSKLDLAIALIGEDKVVITFGDGAGNLGFPEEFPVGNAPQSLAVGDFNGDSKLDVATANVSDEESVSILLGDGKWHSALTPTHIALKDTPFAIAAGDFNRDGNLDLATAHAARLDSIVVLLGDGRGGFKFNGSFPAGDDPLSLAIADFNGDNKLDVVAVNGVKDSISLLFGDGTGQLGAAASVRVGKTPISVAVGDINGDGKPDIVTANQNSHDASILLNR